MLAYLARRLLLTLCAALLVALLTFMLSRTGGDAAAALAGDGATGADIAQMRQHAGLDRPIIIQFIDWLGQCLRGNFGQSLLSRRAVAEILLEKLPTTVILGGAALSLTLVISIPLSLLAAHAPDGFVDRLTRLLALVGQAMPGFWVALLLVLEFGVRRPWFPISGNDGPTHFILPAITLALGALPPMLRLLRTQLHQILPAPHMITARAKGARPAQALAHHALPLAAPPVIASTALQLGHLWSGSVAVETVFALDGLGFLTWETIRQSDLPVLQGVVLTSAALYLLAGLLGDLVAAGLDPRLRAEP